MVRPMKNCISGAPGQLLTATAPANGMKSAGLTLCLDTNGFWRFTISSRPMFGWNAVSMLSNSMIEPSAPPPLTQPSGECNHTMAIITGIPELALGFQRRGNGDTIMEDTVATRVSLCTTG